MEHGTTTRTHTLDSHSQASKQKNAHVHNFLIVKPFKLIINNDRSNAINILKAIFCSFGLYKNCSHISTSACKIIYTNVYTRMHIQHSVLSFLLPCHCTKSHKLAARNSCLQKVQVASYSVLQTLPFVSRTRKKRFCTVKFAHAHTNHSNRCVKTLLNRYIAVDFYGFGKIFDNLTQQNPKKCCV